MDYYKDTLKTVFNNCYGNACSCPVRGVTLGDAEALLGDPDRPVVFLGLNPNPLDGLTYPRDYDEYWRGLTTAMRRLKDHRVWNRPKRVLQMLSAVSGYELAIEKDVCIFNTVHCLTRSSDPLDAYLPHIKDNFPCSLVNGGFLKARSRIIFAHGGVALNHVRTVFDLGKRRTLSASVAEDIHVRTEGTKTFVVIPSYHLMSQLAAWRADASMPALNAKMAREVTAIRKVLSSSGLSRAAEVG